MLKKVHMLNPSSEPSLETSSMEKSEPHCIVCKTPTKSFVHVCDSGHVICKNCQKVDTSIKDSNERGDYIPEKGCTPINNKKELQVKISDSNTQDFASGDHDDALMLSQAGTNSEKMKDCKLGSMVLVTKERPKSHIDIKYKNDNYQESKSSLTSNIDSSKDTEAREQEMKNCKIVPRPVVCPVTNCSKMVTIDSIMLHFHFDHSKVPKIILDDILPKEVSLKSSNLSTEIQCIATFIIENRNSACKILNKKSESISSVRNSIKDNKLLLLMAVRLPTSPVKLPSLKCDTSRVFTRSIHTQTEKYYDVGISTESLSKSSNDYKSCSCSNYDQDEVLLLWLCKFDSEERVYSITLLGEDKKRGYCYIGDAVHVRDKQDPSSLYDKSDCLIVKGSAVSSLYDLQNQITAIVSIIG